MIAAAFEIVERSGQAVRVQDGAHDGSARVWGSNIHGLFENASFRHRFLQKLWEMKGGPGWAGSRQDWSLEHEYDRLADLVRAHLDMAAVYRLLEAKR